MTTKLQIVDCVTKKNNFLKSKSLQSTTVKPQDTRPQAAWTLQVHVFELGPKEFELIKFMYRGSPLSGFWDLKKTALRKIRISGTAHRGSSTNAKIPHLRVHKPKTTVVAPVVKTA